MNITVTILPQNDTTQREVAALAAEAADAVRGLRDVIRVGPAGAPAPAGAKGLGSDLASLLVSLPPSAISGVFGVLTTVAARAPAATKVKVSADGVELEFDPRRTTPEQMAAMVASLRTARG